MSSSEAQNWTERSENESGGIDKDVQRKNNHMGMVVIVLTCWNIQGERLEGSSLSHYVSFLSALFHHINMTRCVQRGVESVRIMNSELINICVNLSIRQAGIEMLFF